MNIHLTDEQSEFKQMARDLATSGYTRMRWSLMNMNGSPELIKECAELGYFGFTVPEQYGGLGQSTANFVGVIEEISAACAGFAIMLSVHNSLACEIINQFVG